MSAFPRVFAGRRYAVVGLGRNGLPAARALSAMGADVSVWDDDADARETAGMPVVAPDALADNLDALVLSPGIPHRLPAPHLAAARATALGIKILSDAEIFFQAVRAAGSRARFVGITGTNGKSTTTALLAHILAGAGVPVAAGGNLGPAALALPLLGDDGVYVLEMSSYMLERLATLRSDAAAMLNLSPDHLDRHGDMAGYAAAKRMVFDRQTTNDLAVIGVDDPWSRAMAAALECHPPNPLPQAREGGRQKPPPALAGGGWERVRRISATDPPLAQNPALPGPHNAQNAAAATALARHLGVTDAAITEGMKTFPGLPHRQQVVGIVNGTMFVNDSKATNADAAARSLACYDRVVWIAGGIGKEGGIEPLAPLFGRVSHAVLIGRDAEAFARTLATHAVPHTLAVTLDAAVPVAARAAKQTGAVTVLLAPAAASFDQFSGFDARGDRFCALVAAFADVKAA